MYETFEQINTPEEFSKAMMEIKTGSFYGERMYDEENQHRDADHLMCKVLRSLGYGDGVDIFNEMNKWYS